MFKIALVAGAMAAGVAALIIARSPRLSVRRWIAAGAMLAIAVGVIATSLGKWAVGMTAMALALAGFFALRTIEPGGKAT